MSQAGCDILAFGAHPDDIELTVGGTLLRAASMGQKTVGIHLTAGEKGTRGSEAIRRQEAESAASKLGLATMEILGIKDGEVFDNQENRELIVSAIRRHQPKIVLAPYFKDLHPDHEATGQLVRKAQFLAGVKNWGQEGKAWRVEGVLYYMSHEALQPTIIVDIAAFQEAKKAAALCYRSQFFDAEGEEPNTFISNANFWHWWEGRAAYWGHFIGSPYGEPYFVDGPLPCTDPSALFAGFGKYQN